MQVDLREQLAARTAEVASAATVHAELSEQLTCTRAKLEDTVTTLHQADVRNTEVTSAAAATRRELEKEQQELQHTQGMLQKVQEQLDKARHWNDIQVCNTIQQSRMHADAVASVGPTEP